MKKILRLTILFLFAVVQISIAQDRQITGKVIDQTDSNPIAGASVKVKGTTKGTATDANGNFKINVNDKAILVFTSLGFESQEKTITTATDLIINLISSSTDLLEVAVVGYGTQKKANLTGSVSTLNNETLGKRQVASSTNLLQGLAAGLTVSQQSGKPGADGATINIRGIGSVSAGTTPLILVDNVEMSLDAIDVNNIESISVLKDAASTAIFGSRAANGVILVKTKRGTNGISISYNNFASWQQATNLPQRLTAIEHMELYNQALVNSGKAKAFPDQLIADYKSNPADNFNYFDTDWTKGVLTNSGLMNNHNFTVSSGTDKMKIFASATYLNQKGLTANTDFTRYDLRINSDIKLSSKLNFAADIVYNKSITNYPGGASPEFIIRQMLGLPAIGAGKYGDGQYGTAAQSNNRNPIALAEASGYNRFDRPTTILTGTLNYNPFKNLAIMGMVSTNSIIIRQRTFFQNYKVFTPDYVSKQLVLNSLYPGQNQLNEGFNEGRINNYLFQTTYSLLEGKSDFKILGGFQANDFSFNSFGASRTTFPGDQAYLGLGTENLNNSGGASENSLASFFGRINYVYDNKYLLEINGRYDGASRFSQALGKQWGFFPSASVGWILSEENFFSGAKSAVNYAKIRASYGLLGNQNIGTNNSIYGNFNVGNFYPFAGTFSSGQDYYFNNNFVTGLAITQASNNSISWEKSAQFDVGVDLALLNNKLTITADYYQRKISDLLLTRPIPNYVGQSSPFINAGSMTNTGWEFLATYKNKVGAFKYEITGIISDVVNNVDDLGGQDIVSGLNISRVGFPLRSYYGYIADGLFQTTDVIPKVAPTTYDAAAVPFHFANTVAGDIRYKDVSGPNGVPDGKIDQNDRVLLGNNFPRYEYSLNANLAWKGVDLGLFFQGVGKRDNYISGTGAWAFFAADFIPTAFAYHKDSWRPDNPNASYPRLTDGINNNQVNSSFWVRDGSYLRLKNVTLGYTLPKGISETLKLKSLRIYVSGQNLLTKSNYFPGFDPEGHNNNGEFYPVMKTYTVGLNVKF